MLRIFTRCTMAIVVSLGLGSAEADQDATNSAPKAKAGAELSPTIKFEIRQPSSDTPVKVAMSVPMNCIVRFKCSDQAKVPDVVLLMFKRGKATAGQFTAKPVALGDGIYECKTTIKTPASAGKYDLTVQADREVVEGQAPTTKLKVTVQ
ncbi:hypothetical protein SAMN05444166_4676 [Singulisphaera sp. GP187]|uniref:hypothetical protein n=1 Tax=Singulisphaera sp. GP187 TaxID=1882752 RepID=UPI000928944E|nr:hypothetical protein [Singulisphaera sp. GP187]SIO43251.1 hypothetical protein SAMN05444166_4676 [Singulisphaera sp. GP187]